MDLTIYQIATKDIIYQGYKTLKRKFTKIDHMKLLNSIKEKGILHPLIITKDNRLLNGFRRLLIAKTISLKTVPCIICPDDGVEEYLMLKST
jgi:ParB-like chromosome segregation protein Spo0J